MKTARDLVEKTPICIPPSATLEEVARTLVKNRISGVPVVENDQLIGIVSEYQLMALVYDAKLKTESVSRFMTKDVISVNEDASIAEIANLFIVQRIRRVPVISNGGKLMGLISRPDLLRHIVESDFAEAEHAAC